MNKIENQSDPENIEIVDYENLIKEEDVQKIERFFYQLDQFKLNILKSIVEALGLYSEQAIGEPIVLSMLFDIKARVQKYIALKEAEIPDIANVKFVLSGNLKDGRKILISKEFASTSKVQTDRKISIEYYKEMLNNDLSLTLGNLLIDIEKTISEIKNMGSFSNIEDFYPQLKNKDEKPDPQNETAQKMKAKAKENEPERKEILDTAFQIIKDSKQPLTYYKTPSGDANSKLYNHPKIIQFKNGNSRRWIRDAMKDGTFKNMMATDGQDLATE